MNKDKILLIDFMNLVHMANIKFGPSANNKLSFTIVYNFFRGLRAKIEEFNPTKIFLCCEGANNFRYKLYSGYKANRLVKYGGSREAISEDPVHLQANIIIDLLKHLPVSIVKADTFEADDVVATLADNLKDEELIIISSDSDYTQLLQKSNIKNLKLYNPRTKSYISPPDYFYLIWKSIAGDKSDNIPGIASNKIAMGAAKDPKKLEELLSSYEKNVNFRLNRELIELKVINGSQLEIVNGISNFDTLKSEFQKMEFSTFFKGDYWERFVNTFNCLS